MEPFFNASQTILDFLTLLEVERTKGKSELIDENGWQDLQQLDRVLETMDRPHEIANAILDWCEKYPEINRVFNQENWSIVRGDMVKKGKKIPVVPPITEAEIVNNKSKIREEINKTNQN